MRRGLQKSRLIVEHIAEGFCDQRGSFLRCNSMHVYEVKPRREHRGVDLPSITADQMMP